MAKFLLALDPGHVNCDSGAIGFDGVQEQHLNQKICNRVQQMLVNYYSVVQTTVIQPEILTLQHRTEFINYLKPDFMLSIHCNGFSYPDVKGIEIFPKHNGSQLVNSISKRLSNNILSKIIEVSRLEGYDYVNRGVKEKNLHMIREIDCPGALLECGFLTNYKEFLWLNSPRGQLAIAYAISQAIENYIEAKILARQ